MAAYNWGPGNWDKALAANGGDPKAALASAPAETQNYVPSVLSKAGGEQASPALAFGQSVKGSAPKDNSVVMKRVQDLKDFQSQGVNLSQDQ